MTLHDCLLYARDHAYANRISHAELAGAGADVGIAASALMPAVSLSSSGSVSFGRNIDPETNTYDNNRTLYTGFGLSMTVPLFDGLVSTNTLKAARTAKARQLSQARIEEDRISMEVIRAFYNVSYCKAMVSHLETQLRRDSTDLAATLRGAELGTKSGADVAEMQAIVASGEFDLSSQRTLLAKAYLNLRALMGMELLTEPLDLEESPDPLPEELPAAVNPRLTEAELALQGARYSHRAALGAFSPVISLQGGISTSYFRMMGQGNTAPSFGTQWHANMGEYVGVSVTIPIFTGLSRVHRLRRAKADLLEARLRLEQTRYEVEKETAEALLDLLGAKEEYAAARKRLAAEELAAKATRRRYELGSASALDLYTSRAKLTKALAECEGKRIQQIVSAITLAYCQGARLIKY